MSSFSHPLANFKKTSARRVFRPLHYTICRQRTFLWRPPPTHQRKGGCGDELICFVWEPSCPQTTDAFVHEWRSTEPDTKTHDLYKAHRPQLMQLLHTEQRKERRFAKLRRCFCRRQTQLCGTDEWCRRVERSRSTRFNHVCIWRYAPSLCWSGPSFTTSDVDAALAKKKLQRCVTKRKLCRRSRSVWQYLASYEINQHLGKRLYASFNLFWSCKNKEITFTFLKSSRLFSRKITPFLR